MTSAVDVLNQARAMLGVSQYSQGHQRLINEYNSVVPVPVGYLVNADDDWCDVFVTTMFDRVSASHLIGRECGVERHIAIFKQLGIWIEDGSTTPRVGDIITFSWRTNSQPNNSWGDHIGIVESVTNGVITTIEGNSNRQVRRNTYPVGHGNIRGFARPKYGQESLVPDDDVEVEYYTVVAGDSLWGIATRHGLTVQELCQMNNITINTTIHPGDQLLVSVKELPSTPPITDNPDELLSTYSEYGVFTANRTLKIRNSHISSAQVAAELYSGESVTYDSIYLTKSYVWISYISYSGVRRYIAIRTNNNGVYGPIFGTVE